MSIALPNYSPLTIWQYWLTVLRLLSALVGLIFSLLDIIFMEITKSWGTTASLVHTGFMVGVWLLVIINDIYMLTLDMKRRHTYIGCIGAQFLISISSLIMSTVAAGVSRTVEEGLVVALCLPWSLGLIVILLPIAISLRVRDQLTWVQLWKLNTKDAFLFAEITPKTRGNLLSITGLPRDSVILHRQVMSISGAGIARSFRRLFFRRISPVETKGYALARNGFALLAMSILIFRLITALIQAQNKIGTRISSRYCGMFSQPQQLQVLMQFGSTESKGSDQNFRAEVWEEFNKTLDVCKQEVTFSNYPAYSPFSLLLFTCNASRVDDWPYRPRTYHIKANSADGSALNFEDMPLVWLVDHITDVNILNIGAAPYYTTPWRLNPGYHTEAEAGLIRRGFISSSIWRDLVLNSDPEYTYISLYPIDASATRPLQNETTATARVHPTFEPKARYLRDKAAFDAVKSDRTSPLRLISSPRAEWECDFVEDYRSGTILDILSSVGGLFAILQTLHVLLFGRPLFWGLLGTKLINPFGLLSSFGSEGFKRRLHEKYGREPTEDNPDWIHTAAFLRDFVVDFGPLQDQPDQGPEPKRVIPVATRTGTADSRMPLMLTAGGGDALISKEEYDLEFPPTPLTVRARRNSIV